ncbi:MFS transporter [Rhizosphaericola mali]|uniref:Multidrug effflux MFS transporter n=1 Tax=Rhizosphaericola mali TaxID=2545455 RepID=A0A5P2FY62_9BACT|nr:MFS transporter [Rhizosphaericola mali]QES88436.1 multidrug effflux MFS transporter [Rhizosphaericola mali]
MKKLKKEHERISTILAFILIPLSGFAMDVYIPSFPQMANDLQVTPANIKLTMTVYLISYGVSQLFVGMILDSFGRYKIHLWSLAIFVVSNIFIVLTKDIYFIHFLRFVQGITISFIVVSKRAFFIDVFTGEKRKHYTSMLTVVWSTAPILAPFLGGYLQKGFGWQSNFYFLAIYGFVMLLLELKYSGETIIEKQSLKLKNVFQVYSKLLSAKDFSIGILVLGFSYGMVMVFGMSIPFIVEHHFHLSPVESGYCALSSGVAIFFGGFLSKKMIDRPFYKKLWLAAISEMIVALFMLFTSGWSLPLFALIGLVMLIHFWQGFTYNSYFTYSLVRFPEYAATASGLASGGSYIVFSIASYFISNSLVIDNQKALSYSYLILLAVIVVLLLILKRYVTKSQKKLALA